ncbi:MAG: hypothetical protein EOP67_73730, partial [Sphingomonas sp.]
MRACVYFVRSISMHRIFAAIVAAGACASSLQAQTRPPVLAEPVLTLADALGRAGASSPFQDAASAGVRAAEAQRRVAALRPNPSIVAETENVAGSGIYRGLRSSETTLGLALPLERGGNPDLIARDRYTTLRGHPDDIRLRDPQSEVGARNLCGDSCAA